MSTGSSNPERNKRSYEHGERKLESNQRSRLVSQKPLGKGLHEIQIVVPDYIRKYGVQVASGGMGLVDQFIDNGVATLAPSSTTAPKNINTARK
ncbi:hypothetical protein BSLG_006462 [Batrachochytrium salamandrivorans]|nr:hypothetical protein BSLG_006462 [Batrachochytrium salamandrivorans]